ncbi:MAG: succinate dehydrogenase/fumarate reductase iron-sulfur subunit [Candidatus Micrarchaeota archaeon]|nr:succinate dehydrogenase/fumarate reductase iron-sulfur subunit [Candidatus Micrarchaeota archaeon]
MRYSKYAIFNYVGILGVPFLIFLMFIYAYLGSPTAVNILSYFLLAGIMIFAATGVKEVYLTKKLEGSKQPIITGETTEHNAVNKASHDTRQVTVTIKRFNSSTNQFDNTSYKFNAAKHTTVLESLLSIKAYGDNSLSVRCNCRMGICGSCGMNINGKQKLACETNLLEVAEDTGTVEVSPMLGHPLLKDLVNDFDSFFEKHKSLHPGLERRNETEKFTAPKEYKQSAEQLDKYLPYSYCIMCGLCLDACPVVNSNPKFVGPQSLSQVYRYYMDSRDQGGKGRLFSADTEDGVWGCEFAGSCSKACPKGVNPSAAIQLLKADLIKDISKEE